MDIISFIYDLDIPNGETKRLVCPNCGRNKYEKTFTVTNNMGSILWNCYKASCDMSGSMRNSLTVSDIKKLQVRNDTVEDNKPFDMPPYIIAHRNQRNLISWCAEWRIEPDELGLMYDVKEHRVVFPVIHDNVIVDATGRSLGNRFPKWKRYGKNNLPYVSGSGSVAVVVEDCVSAAVVGGYNSFVGVAILGTSLQESHKGYLSQFSTAIVALDPDALPKTLQFAKELRGYVKDVKVLRLNDDIKYQRQEDIKKLLSFKTDKGE
tara:strand:- start:2999 stop:3790 length:792 start_codon:yes stop_codon:yes gene_type:complete